MSTLTMQSEYGVEVGRMKVYGLEVVMFANPITGEETWKLLIDHPFQEADGRLRFGVNEKVLRLAQERKVRRFLLGHLQFYVPSKRDLKAMEKRGEVEYRESIFTGREGFKIYHLKVA